VGIEQDRVAGGVGLEEVGGATARPHDELPHAGGGGDAGAGRLARRQRQPGEALGVVPVPVEDDVDAGVLEDLPQAVHRRVRRGLHARPDRRAVGQGHRVEAGLVPHGDHAGRGVLGQVGPEPLRLGAVGVAAAGVARQLGGDVGRAVGVEHDDVPAGQVVAVVAVGSRAGGRTEVGEVIGGAGAVAVLVVAGDGVDPADYSDSYGAADY